MQTNNSDRGELLVAIRNGLLLGAAVWGLLWAFGFNFGSLSFRKPAQPIQSIPAMSAPQNAATRQADLSSVPTPSPLPDLGTERASEDVLRLARWTLASGDHKRLPFVVVDKKEARVYLFEPSGKLRAATPALMGSAHGDDSVPGIGTKAIADVLPSERTTPAGRFVARMGMNTLGEDVVWVDYDAAVSMHRVRATVAKERRLERLASPTADDNRVSWGCINLPPAFYENVLSPTVKSTGAIIYVLPETKRMDELFAGV